MSKLNESDRELRAMVMQANRQLNDIEKNKMRSAPSYRAVQQQYFNKKGYKSRYLGKSRYRPRFRNDVGNMSAREKNLLRSRVNEFLEMKTSTVQGIEDMYSKTKEKFEQLWGNTIGYDEYINMWEKGITEEFVKQFGSSEVNTLISTLSAEKMNAKQMERFLKKYKSAEDIDTLYRKLGKKPRKTAQQKGKTSYKNKGGFYKV